MDLLTYISDMSRRHALAAACGTSSEYLWQIATRWRGKRPSPALASVIERESARLGPESVPKEPMIFGESRQSAVTQISTLADTRMSKRALRARLGFANDKQLATVLGLPLTQVESWEEERALPALPEVLRLLGHQPQAIAEAPPEDPDETRIVPVETA